VRHRLAALRDHCAAFDRDVSTIEVTQLSTTLVGRHDEELVRLIDTHRPRKVTASAYASRVNAGSVPDQIGRFRGLADAGVQTAIVSLPDLDGTPAAIERFAGVVSAFA
jgi:hypothetical protein